jgi:hypothetical protein
MVNKITVLRDEKGRFVKGCISLRKGKHISEENKRFLSKIQKGRHISPSTEFKKGMTPWNKGIKWWTKKMRIKQIESKKGIHSSPKTEFKKGDPRLIGNKTNIGRKHTEEWKRRNSERLKILWKNKNYKKRVGNAILIGQKKANFSERMRDKMKKHWQNPEYKEKVIRATLKGLLKRPTSLEQKFIEIIQKYNLPYKYVGNGSFLIGFKNPDFININGDKSCIEVANRFHHQGDWADKRREHFKKLGWDCAIIFEDEIKDESKFINDLWF